MAILNAGPYDDPMLGLSAVLLFYGWDDGGSAVASDLVSDLTAAEIAVTTTATATISRFHVCTGTTSDYTVTLPAASGLTGKLLGIRMSPALTKLVTIDGNASETIDGSLTRVMWAGESCLLLCDGSNWFKIAGKSIAMTAQMSRAAAQSISDSTVTKIAFDTVVFNAGGMADATTNDRFDIVRPGRFQVMCSWYVSVSGTAVQSRIHVNGSERFTEQVVPTVIPIAIQTFDLALADTVEFNVYQVTGGARNTDTSDPVQPRMTVEELGPW